jgi:hypothetical protein
LYHSEKNHACPYVRNSILSGRLKDLYNEHDALLKNRKRNSERDQLNQKDYTKKLDTLFDISHSDSEKLIKNQEDLQFLKLQQESRTGSIGPVDIKLAGKEKRSVKRQERIKRRASVLSAAQSSTSTVTTQSTVAEDGEESGDPDSTNSSDESGQSGGRVSEEHKDSSGQMEATLRKKRKRIISPAVASVLDRTNTSVRKSTMILASVINEAGEGSMSTVLSKSTVHLYRQRRSRKAAEQIKQDYQATKSVVHWDGKLLPDITGSENCKVERLPVLLSSIENGETKLLGIPKLTSGTGQATANAVQKQLQSWECESVVIGMCFDTTAVNT